jgi:signal transduction histidine kinase
MNFYAVSALINLATSLILGGFTFFKNPKRAINVSFFLLTISISVWSLAYFLWQVSDSYESALLWTRILSIGSTLIPILYLQWILLVLGLLKDKKRLFLLIFGYLATAVFLYFSFSNLFVKEVAPELGFKFFPKAGPVYSIYLAFSYVGLVGYGLVELIRNYYKRKGVIRYQIKYIILATLISFIGGATNFFLWYDVPIPPVGNILVALYTIILFYAMAKYRLMDIRVVIQRFIIFTGTAAIAYGAYYLVNWSYEKFLGGSYNTKAYLIGLIVAPLFVGIFFLLSKWIKVFANKYLFFSFYNYQETITKLAEELNDSINLDKIVNSIVNTIKETMQLNRAGVLLIDKEDGGVHYKIARVMGFDETNGISLVKDSFLTRYLQETRKALIREELSMLAKETARIAEKQSFERLENNMEKIEASLCLPLISGNNLIGIIVLGSKLSGDAYSKEDLQLLEMLSRQVSVAIENAKLYKQVQDFSDTLQQQVDEQTKEIRSQKDKIQKAYEVEKTAHKLEKKALDDLRQLDANKTDFMLITQHHLRTPLSVNAGFIDLILGGTFGKIPAKLKSAISKLKESTQKEIEVVNELLDASGYQIGKETIHLDKPIDLEALMEETLKDLTAEAKAKDIYLKYEKQGEIPKIPADRTKLKLVLTNVIDNCIKYTAEGGVTVTMEVKNDKLLISVTDTGIGLSDEVIKNLFKQTFHRSEQAKRLFAVGKGLGLFLSGKIIEGHNGRIWAESKGDGKGSGFYIELPLKQKIKQPIKVENNISANIQ